VAGQKLFINGSNDKTLNVTLYIRQGPEVANSAGTQRFTLGASQSLVVTYGDDNNIYLNGLALTSIFNGQIVGEQEFVISRGQILDNELNMNSVVYFNFVGGVFQVQTSNSGI
jgi:hypothetical protein